MSRPDVRILDTGSDRDALGEIQDVLDELWSGHAEVPAVTRISMSSAAAEVGANILEHAGREHDVRIRMEVRLLPDAVHVEFTDDGRPAEVDLNAVEMPDELADRGRGLALAQAMLESLTYERGGHGNRWTLISRRFG
ncbi:MAG: ATP-binding protein [Mycobacterium sp.]